MSAKDRAKTIKAISDPHLNPKKLGKPGHIFPLKAKNGGVLRRRPYWYLVDLTKLAGLQPAGVIVEILNDDGSMARTKELFVLARSLILNL